MKNKKLIPAILLCITLAFTTLGCEKKKSSGETEKITWWTTNNAPSYVTSYNDVEAYKVLGEKFGVEIEFIHPISTNVNEGFNTMIASGDYADIMEYGWAKYPGGSAGAIEDGVILDIAELVKKHAPNFVKLMNSRDDYKVLYDAVKDKMSGFGTLKDDVSINANFGPTIRKDWLDKLGLEIPETMEDWYTVLTAFKNGDPNGNGKKDEIPLVADNAMDFLTLSAAYGVLSDFQIKDGKVTHGAVHPEFKEFLKEMNKWYKEGLIDSEFASMTRKNTDAKVTTDIAGAYVGYTGSQMGNYIKAAKDSVEGFELVAAPWPKAEGSKNYCGYLGMNGMGGLGTVAISAKAENPELIVKMLDYNYSEEGMLLHNWGIKDVTYTEENGVRKYTDLIMNDPEGKDPVGALSKYALPIYGGTAKIMMGDAYSAVSRPYKEQQDAATLWASSDTSLLIPAGVAYNAEESEIRNKHNNDIWTLMMETVTKMIMGIRPIDDFDKFVKEMDGMGLKETIAANQSAYERYMGK